VSNQVSVLFFASLRDDVGTAQTQVRAANITELITALATQLSQQAMAALTQENVRIAINQQLIEGDVVLEAGDEIAFLPPVTGG